MSESLGEIAVRLGFLTRQKLEEALRIQSELPAPVSLGEILVQRKFITKEQLEQILREQRRKLQELDPLARRRREAELFGKLAMQLGLVTKLQVEGALRWLELSRDPGKTMAQVMIEKGMLTQEQVNEILSRQRRVPMLCRCCNMKFTIVTISDKKQVPCPKCGKMLEPIAAAGGLPGAGLEIRTQMMRAVKAEIPAEPASKGPSAKATCPICGNEFASVPDIDGRVMCPNCSTTFPVR